MANANLLFSLKETDFRYAFFFQRGSEPPVRAGNAEIFPAASIIKLPILLAWALLERRGELSRFEMCDLDSLPQVQGAGFSWLLAARRLPYQDVLLLMMAVSDNLCANLVIERIGIPRLNQIFQEDLGLKETRLERKLMDYEARARGRENWISAADCERFFDLFAGLSQSEKAWVEPLLLANQDDLLLKRNIPRDTLDFYHKTGSMSGVLHDWGYTRGCRIFLLTQDVRDEPAAFEVFAQAGELLISPPTAF